MVIHPTHLIVAEALYPVADSWPHQFVKHQYVVETPVGHSFQDVVDDIWKGHHERPVDVFRLEGWHVTLVTDEVRSALQQRMANEPADVVLSEGAAALLARFRQQAA